MLSIQAVRGLPRLLVFIYLNNKGPCLELKNGAFENQMVTLERY